MKTCLFSLILFLMTICSFGQVNYERGYLINNDNQRIECLIKNCDWLNNPKEFEYKLSENDDPKKGDLTSIKEFGIFGFSKFIRVDTKIDRSPVELANLSGSRNPIWSQEQLFLKVLLEGKASLYYYTERNFVKFFYSVTDSLIQQLIYKEYLTEGKHITANFGFRQQLWSDVRCANTTISSLENINYRQNELERYFKKYYECIGDSFIIYERGNRDFFNLRVTPGINYTSLSISNKDNNRRNTDFDKGINFRIGIEAEMIFPFNKNKWGIVIEPTYQYFNSQKQNSFEITTIKYSSIEFPFGIRHYIFLNENLKIFLNAFYIPNYSFNFNSKIDFSKSIALDISPIDCYAVGGGIDYKRIRMEVRYYTNRDILNDYLAWYSAYRRFSVLIGYRLLKISHKNTRN